MGIVTQTNKQAINHLIGSLIHTYFKEVDEVCVRTQKVRATVRKTKRAM